MKPVDMLATAMAPCAAGSVAVTAADAAVHEETSEYVAASAHGETASCRFSGPQVLEDAAETVVAQAPPLFGRFNGDGAWTVSPSEVTRARNHLTLARPQGAAAEWEHGDRP